MKPRRKTGELEVMREIWDERPHKCGVCGDKLPWFSVRLMAHVLSKGAHPAMRLDKDNIELLCYPHHHEYDHNTYKAVRDERFGYLFNKQEELKQKYYGSKQ